MILVVLILVYILLVQCMTFSFFESAWSALLYNIPDSLHQTIPLCLSLFQFFVAIIPLQNTANKTTLHKSILQGVARKSYVCQIWWKLFWMILCNTIKPYRRKGLNKSFSSIPDKYKMIWPTYEQEILTLSSSLQ